eukprot:761965-Hanusia_phi.AAC.1
MTCGGGSNLKLERWGWGYVGAEDMRNRYAGGRLCRAWLRSSRYRDLGRVADTEGADKIFLISTCKKQPSNQLMKNVFITIADECRPCDFQQGTDKVPGVVRLHSAFKRTVSSGEPYIITSMHVYFLRDAENKQLDAQPVHKHHDYQLMLKSAFLWERSEDISYLSGQGAEWQQDGNQYQDPSLLPSTAPGDQTNRNHVNPFIWQTSRTKKVAAAMANGGSRHNVQDASGVQHPAALEDNRVPRKMRSKIQIVISNDAILSG